MTSFQEIKHGEIWISMLLFYLDADRRFFRVLIALAAVQVHLIVETGYRDCFILDFESVEAAKDFVQKLLIHDNLLEREPFWSNFYPVEKDWFFEEFNLKFPIPGIGITVDTPDTFNRK